MPIALPTGQGGSFLGEEGFSLIPTGVLEISNAPIRSKEYKIRASVFGSYHVRPGGYILEEADSNIPIGNEIIFGGGLGLKPFPFLEFVGENSPQQLIYRYDTWNY